ncbi:hypothetical protein BN1708_019163, partial [Verticillium longisporum]
PDRHCPQHSHHPLAPLPAGSW